MGHPTLPDVAARPGTEPHRQQGQWGAAQCLWGGWPCPFSTCCPHTVFYRMGDQLALVCPGHSSFRTESPTFQETAPSSSPRQTKTVGHLYCRQPSQRLQATRNSERRGWAPRCPSLPNPPHLHTWPHAHLHPGREGIVQRKANSNPCPARLSLPLHQGDATGP